MFVQKCCPSSAPILIKSKVLYRKTLKLYTVHFYSASGVFRSPDRLPWLCPWIPLGDFRPPDGLVPFQKISDPPPVNPSIVRWKYAVYDDDDDDDYRWVCFRRTMSSDHGAGHLFVSSCWQLRLIQRMQLCLSIGYWSTCFVSSSEWDDAPVIASAVAEKHLTL